MPSWLAARWVLPLMVIVASLGSTHALAVECPPLFERKWGINGNTDGNFLAPVSVAVGPDGAVYVADSTRNRIQVFSPSGILLAAWGTSGNGSGQFRGALGIAVAPNSLVYVADSENNRVQWFTGTGVYLGQWGTVGTGDGQFRFPRGLCVGPSGNVYVADTQNNRIQKFTSDGVFLTKWGTQGSGAGSFNEPFTLASDPSGALYVADFYNNRIQKFDSNGAFLTAWPVGDGLFAVSAGDGNVYVTKAYNHSIWKFSSTGLFLVQWGQQGSQNGFFQAPRGVAAGPDGVVYVADTFNYRIQKFVPDTQPGCTPPPPPPFTGEPRILLHIKSTTTKNACIDGALANCQTATVSAGLSQPTNGPFYFVYLLVARSSHPTIAGLTCGLMYETGNPGDMDNQRGIDIFGWTLCASLQFPTDGDHVWPRPGGGNLITWDPENLCQTGATATAGYFYLAAYGPDRLSIVPRPIDGAAEVANCNSAVTALTTSQLGSVAFSANGVVGCNPCLGPCSQPVPVTRTTWSGIKNLIHK